MESALISLVSVALVIIATLTMMMNAFTSASTIADSWSQMVQQTEDMRLTEIIAVPPENYDGGNINLMVVNEGQANLYNFRCWDIIVQYQTGGVYYIDYTDNATPDSNEWIVAGIYLSDNVSMPEIFDPDILNPGETVKLYINLDPEIGAGEKGKITTTTSNGVASQCIITRQ